MVKSSRFARRAKGFSLVELMMIMALLGIVISVGPSMLLQGVRFFRMHMARTNVQKNARTTLDLINRNLRQATATSVVITNRPNQPAYSWIQFTIDKGQGEALGNYGFYQEGKNLMFLNNGSTSTLADNLRYLAFTYPKSDDTGIISVSMTFEEQTYAGYSKALQLSIEKVRVMN